MKNYNFKQILQLITKRGFPYYFNTKQNYEYILKHFKNTQLKYSCTRSYTFSMQLFVVHLIQKSKNLRNMLHNMQ